MNNRISHGLRPDGQAFDEVRITTVPRWKESELSGCEWRISANVKLFRKGILVKETSYGDVEAAAKFLSHFMVETVENGGGNFASCENLCDQEGCSEIATTFYEKKKDWCCRCGEKKDPFDRTIRQFCSRHKGRGDCGLDDAADNYAPLLAFRDAAVNEAYEKAAQVADEYFREKGVAQGQPDIGKIKTYLGSKIRALKTAPAKELLFSGQCNHHIPIGQRCSACGR